MFNVFTFTKSITNASKLDRDLRANQIFGFAYDYLTIKGDQTTIFFKRNLVQSEIDSLSSFVSNFSDFSIYDNLYNYLGKEIDPFVSNFLTKIRAQNIEMGITQLGKTYDVLAFFEEKIALPNKTRSVSLLATITTSSLSVTLELLTYYIANPSLYNDLSPFITSERLQSWKNEIEAYLA